jgi:predicted secreted Zn-dependent protease
VIAQERTGRDFPKGLDIDLEYSYYSVSGHTFEDIRRSLEENGPALDGKTFYALTGVETGFRYRHLEEGSTCRLADVGVHARVVMRIPRLSNAEAAPVEVQVAWDRFVDPLTRHEGEHYRIIENSARQIYNALRDMRVHSCRIADDSAKSIIRQI